MRARDVRFLPQSGHSPPPRRCPLSANNGHAALPSDAHAGLAADALDVLTEGVIDLGEHGGGLGKVEEVHTAREFAADVILIVRERLDRDDIALRTRGGAEEQQGRNPNPLREPLAHFLLFAG